MTVNEELIFLSGGQWNWASHTGSAEFRSDFCWFWRQGGIKRWYQGRVSGGVIASALQSHPLKKPLSQHPSENAPQRPFNFIRGQACVFFSVNLRVGLCVCGYTSLPLQPLPLSKPCFPTNTHSSLSPLAATASVAPSSSPVWRTFIGLVYAQELCAGDVENNGRECPFRAP